MSKPGYSRNKEKMLEFVLNNLKIWDAMIA